MSLKCTLGFHQWEGCLCARCGANRDVEHTWRGCQCEKCGKQRDSDHNLENCRCTVCGAVQHQYLPFRCAVCGVDRENAIDARYKQYLRSDPEKRMVDFFPCNACRVPAGSFACKRCGRYETGIQQAAGRYICDTALVSGFGLAVSRGVWGELDRRDSMHLQMFRKKHAVLCVRLQNLLYELVTAAQVVTVERLVVHDPFLVTTDIGFCSASTFYSGYPDEFLRELADACQDAWSDAGNRVETSYWGEKAKGFILSLTTGWQQGVLISLTELQRYIAEYLPFIGPGLGVTRTNATRFLWDSADRCPGNAKHILATVEEVGKHGEYDRLGVGMELVDILHHVCIPATPHT